MSILVLEGFDTMSTQDIDDYGIISTNVITSATDRFGGRCASFTATNQALCIPIYQYMGTGILGFAHKQNGGNRELAGICRDQISRELFFVRYRSDYRYEIAQKNSSPDIIRCVSTNTFTPNVWRYIEVEFHCAWTTGYFRLYIDGILEAEYYGNTNSNIVLYGQIFNGNAVLCYGHYSTNLLDDVYLLDLNGDRNTTRLGEIHVVALRPNAVGENEEWSAYPVENYNYENVDELYQDGDTTYNWTATSGAIDTFGFPAITTYSGAIAGIKIRWKSRKTNVGTRTLRPVILTSGDTLFGTQRSQADGYSWQEEIFETLPATASGWDLDLLNNAEFGYELES